MRQMFLKAAVAAAAVLVVVPAHSVPCKGGKTGDAPFHMCRKAGPADGKLLSARDVVSSRELTPHREYGYFKQKGSAASFPCLMSDKGSLLLLRSEKDTVMLLKGGDGIVYGEAVSRHEFGIDGGIFPAPDGRSAAFYRKDESAVAVFPFLDIKAPGGALRSVRYPMAGTVSERISVGVCDFATGKVVYLDTEGDFEADRYLTNISWSPDAQNIYIQVLDRSQQNLRLNCYSASDGAFVKTLLSEHSDTWVEPQHPLEWIRGRSDECIYSTDNRDGWWNLYLLNVRSGSIRRLAKEDRHMTYLANDGSYVYFTAPDEHPVNNYLWRTRIRDGRTEQLTKEPGWHTIEMSPDCSSYLDVYEALDRAPSSSERETATGRILREVSPSCDPADGWAFTEIEMGTLPTADGSGTNYWRLVKPLGFDPSKKYPLIIYVYGGPHSQLVRNSYLGGLRRWEMYAAQKGFAVFVMDGRGTRRHCAAYEHCIWRHCGKAEAEDQMAAVHMLKELPWVDGDRIGVDGWSYGGFMTLTLATHHPEVFKVAVAGGPVIDWKWYEVMYGERYMSTPQANPDGYAQTSLLNAAKDLKVRTLVIEGGMDDTVVPLHALSFLQKCIDSGVKVDYFTYPKAPHNMRGTDRVHLVEKITDYFIENL